LAEGGGRGYSGYVTFCPLTTRPREDGALFPQDRSQMAKANRPSFLLRLRWLKNIFPVPSISLSKSIQRVEGGKPFFFSPFYLQLRELLALLRGGAVHLARGREGGVE
ncbi:unnamed protein product, partial [Ectocarpus fasciculatus]